MRWGHGGLNILPQSRMYGWKQRQKTARQMSGNRQEEEQAVLIAEVQVQEVSATARPLRPGFARNTFFASAAVAASWRISSKPQR